VTVNDHASVATAGALVDEVLGAGRFVEMPTPITGSEDFSRILQAVPGAMLFLGACVDDDYANAPDNHSPFAAFSDAVLADGAALYSELAVKSLASV
jgi:metal-dependent amidase/aminoacylase/carboxypeptidase family protein